MTANEVRVSSSTQIQTPAWIPIANRTPDRRILIRNGCVLTMDPDLGDFERADVLIEGDTITNIGADLSADAPGAAVLDARGFIVLPGLVDTHRHMWQGQLRRMIPNVDISDYLGVRNAFAVEYRPEDSHISTLSIALGALNSGVTTILDLAHNTRSAEHADGEIAGLRAAGIRGVYAYAPPEAGEWERQWPGDLARVRDALDDDPLLSVRMAQRCFAESDLLTGERVAIARDLGLGLTSDPVGWDEGSEVIVALAAGGHLGPDLTFVHCCDLTDEAWDAMGDAGVGVALSPFVDEILGWGRGYPTVQRAIDAGLVPGLSVDIETTVGPDMFSQMRALLGIQRMRAALGNPDAGRAQLTAKDVLGFATRDGARVIGQGDRTGTLTPGKQADIILIDTTDPGAFPFNNAYGSVVMGADSSNVKAVIVGGEIKKWGHSLVDVDVDEVGERLTSSRDYLAGKVGYRIDLFTDYPTIELGVSSLNT